MSYPTQLAPTPSISDLIQFGGLFFSHPEALADGGFLATFDSPGLYVVMSYDPAWGPLPYRPLCFGESECIWGRATIGHENYGRWLREVGGGLLYRAFHHMPGSTQRQRQFAESALIRHYDPACNRTLSFDLAALLNGRL